MLNEHKIIRIGEVATKDNLIELHRLRLLQGAEQAVAPVDPIKVMHKLARAYEDPENFVLLVAFADNDMVGYLLLQRATYDYSDAEFLVDFGFYVLPQWRKKDVGLRLLEDARGIADAIGLPLHIHVFNPRTRRRGGKVAKAAEVIGYTPIGSVVTFNPSTKVA